MEISRQKIIATKHGNLFSLTDASAWATTKLNSIKSVILPYDIVTQHRCPFIGFLSRGWLAIPNWQVGLGMISKEIRDYFKCLSSNLNQPFCNSFWSRINYRPSVLHSFIQAWMLLNFVKVSASLLNSEHLLLVACLKTSTCLTTGDFKAVI